MFQYSYVCTSFMSGLCYNTFHVHDFLKLYKSVLSIFTQKLRSTCLIAKSWWMCWRDYLHATTQLRIDTFLFELVGLRYIVLGQYPHQPGWFAASHRVPSLDLLSSQRTPKTLRTFSQCLTIIYMLMTLRCLPKATIQSLGTCRRVLETCISSVLMYVVHPVVVTGVAAQHVCSGRYFGCHGGRLNQLLGRGTACSMSSKYEVL